MLHCIVIDDEQLAIDIIAGYIPQVPYLHLSATFQNPIEALLYIQTQKVDLIFLDIQMAQLSGIQFLNLLKNRTQVIIVSAYNEFALDGFEHNVTDFLLKPVSFERFFTSVEKALHLDKLNSNKDALKQDPTTNYFFVKADNKIIKINFSDILFIEGLRNYITINLVNQKKIITLQNMKALEDVLPSNRFIRVQKSYIVNIEKIETIEKHRIFIENHTIPIGESFSAHFFTIINSFNKK